MVIGPQPEFTVGARGAVGKTTTFTVLLALQPAGPGVPAAEPPQLAAKTYRA